MKYYPGFNNMRTTAAQQSAWRPAVQLPPAVLRTLSAGRQPGMAQAAALRSLEDSQRRVQRRTPTNLQQTSASHTNQATERPARRPEIQQRIPRSHSTMSVLTSPSSCQDRSPRLKESSAAQPPGCNLDILRKAGNDPDSLTFVEAEALAGAICRKVTEEPGSAKHAASFCQYTAALQKERPSVFLEALICACQEWFTCRDFMLAGSDGGQQRDSTPGAKPASRRWTAFVEFLAELLVSVAETADRAQILCLAKLVMDCCHTILSSPASTEEEQMECLCRALHRAGEAAEKVDPARMEALVSRLLAEFMYGDTTALKRLILLELLELRASRWEFKAAQHAYFQDRRAMICRNRREVSNAEAAQL
ncbi:MIF4G domain-containing protein A-like [Amblyomma americanum]